MNLSLRIRHCDRYAVVRVTGEIDLYSGPWLEQCLLRLLSRAPCLLLDLSGVTFIDCTGMRMLLAACRQVELRGCPVWFITVSVPVEWLAGLTGRQEAISLRVLPRPIGQRPGPDRLRGARRARGSRRPEAGRLPGRGRPARR